MSSKRPKENKQLCLALECAPSLKGAQDNVVCGVAQQCAPATVLTFPDKFQQTPSFRERVLQDLVRNRVMVD